jgi:hypothetical protein
VWIAACSQSVDLASPITWPVAGGPCHGGGFDAVPHLAVLLSCLNLVVKLIMYGLRRQAAALGRRPREAKACCTSLLPPQRRGRHCQAVRNASYKMLKLRFDWAERGWLVMLAGDGQGVAESPPAGPS